jgi:hypothetical protein
MINLRFDIWTINDSIDSHEVKSLYIPRIGEKVDSSFYNQTKYGEGEVTDVTYYKDEVIIMIKEISES